MTCRPEAHKRVGCASLWSTLNQVGLQLINGHPFHVHRLYKWLDHSRMQNAHPDPHAGISTRVHAATVGHAHAILNSFRELQNGA